MMNIVDAVQINSTEQRVLILENASFINIGDTIKSLNGDKEAVILYKENNILFVQQFGKFEIGENIICGDCLTVICAIYMPEISGFVFQNYKKVYVEIYKENK